MTEQHFPRRISKKNDAVGAPSCRVTTQEALDGYREKTVRVAGVETNALNWVSISSAGAFDMTHCDFSAKLAREDMRHIMRSSEHTSCIS